MRIRLLILAWVFVTALLRATTVTIQNETLRVDCDDVTQTFNLVRKADNKLILAAVHLPLTGKMDHALMLPIGDILTITDPAGNQANLLLYPKSPFLLIDEPLKNTSSEGEVLNQKDIFTFIPSFDVPTNQLVIRGTGGLHSASEYTPLAHPWLNAIWNKVTRQHYRPPEGSYEWLAVADPHSGGGIVTGFTSQGRGTGVITPKCENGQLSIAARTEFGHLRLAPGQGVITETLAIGYFDDVRVGLESWAQQVALQRGTRLPPQPSGFTTWYMEKHGGAADEQSLATLSDFIAKNLLPYGMNFLQIDDRWQAGIDIANGPDKNFTTYNAQGAYPSGMKPAADKIRADGLTPGLWFLPFSGAYEDPWFADKTNLFVKTKDGKPYVVSWAGTCLDMTNPAAQDYVRGIVTNITHNWGYSYLKIDGLFAGLAVQQTYISSDYNPNDDFGNAVFANPAKTNVEAFRDGLKLVRDAAGPGVFILGCNTAQSMRVFGPAMGLVDAMRIGPDNAIDTGSATNQGPPALTVNWQTWRDASPLYGTREYFLNGRVWYNDPDPVYVRTSLTLDEARTEASWTAISGQLFTDSDWLPDLPPERLEILKRTLAPHGKTARPVDFLEHDPARIWQVTDNHDRTRRDVIGLFNFDDAPATITVPLTRLNLPKADSYAAFDFWANQFLTPVKDTITTTLPPHACQIIALRAMEDHPFVLSTSRHLTQGMIDLTDEKWDAATRTLSGVSQVVTGDPYEIRIAAAGPPGTWSIKKCSVELFLKRSRAAETDGEEKIVPATDGSLRAIITSPDTAPAHWTITF